MLDPIMELGIQRRRHEERLREAEMNRLAREAPEGRISAWMGLVSAVGDWTILLGSAMKRKRLPVESRDVNRLCGRIIGRVREGIDNPTEEARAVGR